MAVLPDVQKGGLGRTVVGALEREARDCALDTVFAFTYVPKFFSKIGYMEVDRSELPLKAWKDCMRCPKFQCCDELAMVKYLDGREHHRKAPPDVQDPEVVSIQLPVLKG